MGYCMHQTDNEFFISHENVKKLCFEKDIEIEDIDSFFMKGWFRPSFDDEGNIVSISFEGEKAGGGERELFAEIAKFVHPMNYVQLCGEDGEHWRYFFNDEKCYFVSPTLNWEEPEIFLHVPSPKE